MLPNLSLRSTRLRNCSGFGGGPHMRETGRLVEAYLAAERELVAAVDAAGGSVQLPDGRSVTVGRAEFDAPLGGQCMGTIRKNAPIPPAALRVRDSLEERGKITRLFLHPPSGAHLPFDWLVLESFCRHGAWLPVPSSLSD